MRDEFENKWKSDFERPWVPISEPRIRLKTVEDSEGFFRGS